MNRRSILALIACLGICGWAHESIAQTTRNFIMEASQVVPPSASAATGRGGATLTADQTQLSFAIVHDISAPDANTATATVYNADWGSNGPVVFTLTWVDSNSFSGIWVVDTNGINAFLAGRLYVQIQTTTYPGGELRGQIDLNPNPQPGDVIITEIMYNPVSQEGNGAGIFTSNAEWIELYNITATDIEIGGWYFQDEDVDTNADPCVPLRGGTFPSYVLHSGEVLAVIPDGTAINGFVPSVSDFKDAWFGPGNGDDFSVIQVNSNGTAGGAMVGRNLSNNPVDDGIWSNDLPLSSSTWTPCNSTGFARPDNEILTLNDGTQIIDVVNYGTDFQSDWPSSIPGSITIVPADFLDNPPQNYVPSDFSNYTAAGNDEGFNWRKHTHGDSMGGVRQIGAVGVYGGQDVGSPGYLFGANQNNRAPTAISQQTLSGPGQTEDIYLDGSDQTRPFFGLLLYVIKSLPENGQLIDVASNHVITLADVQGAGYLMPRIPFEHVRYVNDGTCGIDSFLFSTHDGLLVSVPVPVNIFVQCGDVVITEIMYNPDSFENNPCEVEWIELYNVTTNAIDLAGWYFEDDFSRGGDFPSYILGAGSTVVAVPPVAVTAEFETAWSGAQYVHITTNGDTGNFGRGAIAGSNLSNSGESLRIIKPGGPNPQVTDAVFYKSGWDDPLWPLLSPDGPSIYILPPPTGQYDALANDNPSVWDQSFNGFDGAVLNFLTPLYNGDDLGSPGTLQDVVQGGCTASGLAGDGNGNGLVDLTDFEHFVLCQSAPTLGAPGNCACFDADGDGDVDFNDFASFQANFTGP